MQKSRKKAAKFKKARGEKWSPENIPSLKKSKKKKNDSQTKKKRTPHERQKKKKDQGKKIGSITWVYVKRLCRPTQKIYELKRKIPTGTYHQTAKNLTTQKRRVNRVSLNLTGKNEEMEDKKPP